MEPRLDSDLLRTFVAIADSGSFTAAAQVVGRTQSAVSMQVKRLEEAVGQPLFERLPRGVGLTPVGEQLLTRARRIRGLLEEAAQSLSVAAVEGAVRVGIPEEYGPTLLPHILARFAERNPNVEVTVRCEPSLALGTALSRGDLDLAVIVSDTGDEHGEILLHDPTVWVSSARHLCHEQDPLPLAMYERGCWWRDWALRILDEQGKRYRIAYTSASTAGIQAAIASGLAVGVLGRSVMPTGARILTTDDGVRNLPGSNVILRLRRGAVSRAVDSMATTIRAAFQEGAP